MRGNLSLKGALTVFSASVWAFPSSNFVVASMRTQSRQDHIKPSFNRNDVSAQQRGEAKEAELASQSFWDDSWKPYSWSFDGFHQPHILFTVILKKNECRSVPSSERGGRSPRNSFYRPLLIKSFPHSQSLRTVTATFQGCTLKDKPNKG